MRYAVIILTALLCVSVMTANSPSVSADDTYNYDRWGEAVPSQAGYTAEKSLSGNDFGTDSFKSPSDFFCTSDGMLYIADSGNNRIVCADIENETAVTIYDKFIMPDGTETFLDTPSGVYVSEKSGTLYIADTNNSRILVSDMNGTVSAEITKPDSTLYDSRKTFLPQKVIADKGGNIYTVLGNITTGAAMFSADGEFTGFYGANRVEPTAKAVRNYIMGLFMSDEKKARRTRSVPSGITGFDIDGDFIFTCTSSSTQSTDTVKKLNAAGNNIFADKQTIFGDYKPMYDTSQNKVMESAIVDIDISADGNINCLDLTEGRIFQYDRECSLLFVTGGEKGCTGGFEHACAVESYGDRLYVLDSSKNTITVFSETSFGKDVHRAVQLYNDGYYDEALQPWYDVLKRDGNYRYAHIGIASALLRRGDYKGAMKYARLADDNEIYGKAFEGFRREFIMKNGGYIFAAVLLLIVSAVTASKYIKKKRKGADSKK